MNFFEQQKRSKRSSVLLASLMVVAVLCITAVVSLAVILLAHHYSPAMQPPAPSQSFASIANWLQASHVDTVALIVVGMVVVSGLFKTLELKRGGEAVAQRLGCRLIAQDTRDLQERQALNIVEEMALACGAPRPPLYLLEAPGINAFAAGLSPENAIIGITRGALEHLTRDELQGVVAHEFSHIHHGDMRFNLRLTATLHGIMVISLAGGALLQTMHTVSRPFASNRTDNDQSPPPREERKQSAGDKLGAFVFLLGLALLILGAIGSFFGKCIKAAVSREREYLADAAAVQFTRNPDGIAGALKKIGGLTEGSTVNGQHVGEFGHLFFGSCLGAKGDGWLATHPPLVERIRRIEPGWDGVFVEVGARGGEPMEGEGVEG
ncbi:M48 family metalloprotease [Pseudomonas sp.]|uniref:M48 family metalloprotease n=1 Tax=Pseudomonas sp. TaxID=306 RepID=UPI003CC5A199